MMYDVRGLKVIGPRADREFSAAVGNDIDLTVPPQLPGTFSNRRDSQELFK